GVFHLLKIQNPLLMAKSQFFPLNTPPEKWMYDEKTKAYKYEGTYYRHCDIDQSSNLLIRVKDVDSQTIQLHAEDSCLLATPFTSDLILHRIPNEIILDFNYLSNIQFEDGKFNEIRLSPKDITISDTSCGSFSLEEKLWIMFSSGVINNSNGNRFETIEVKLVGDGFIIKKRVSIAELPCYLKGLINNVNQ
ncbi:MAG: hypothetical protein ACE362_13435, partial [Phaeodactylibacter xiamenensis]